VIPRAYIDAWRSHAPWRSDAQVEQDLIVCRTVIEIFRHPVLAQGLVFRGGTALHELYFNSPRRYSEDIDLVQIQTGPIGPIFDAARESLSALFGKPKRDMGPGVTTSICSVPPESGPPPMLRVKVSGLPPLLAEGAGPCDPQVAFNDVRDRLIALVGETDHTRYGP
jgi:hypothetical protein